MIHILKYLVVFLLGFFVAKFWFEYKEEKIHQKEEIKVVVESIQNLSKLIVCKGVYSEMYNYTDTEKYFYDYFSFDKKALISVNAGIEIGYDLSKLSLEIDSVAKQIIVHKIPKEEISIIPDIKYFDLQQSQFNNFDSQDLNKLNNKAVTNIKSSIMYSDLKTRSKIRLFEELSKIYQLSKVYNWEVVDNTEMNTFNSMMVFD